MKKQIAGFLSLLFALSSLCSCSGLGGLFGDKGTEINGIKYESVYSSKVGESVSANESVNYVIDKDISGKNYIRLTLKTDVQLLGEYTYANVDNPSKVATEEFFIEALDGEKEVEFKQFLDSYRKNAVGKFDKILKSIKLTNKSGVAGNVTLTSVSVSDREFPTKNMMVYLEKGEMKIGADLATGGSLSYLERTSYMGKTVDEYIDEEGYVCYGVDKVEEAAQHLSSSVNLVNIYDAGRQIQQSYYANVGGDTVNANGANGYQRGYTYTGAVDGYYWPYNPVQAGDCADNPGQVIDFEVTKNYIYVKARAMDWGKGWKESWDAKYEKKAQELGGWDKLGIIKGGSTTKSYMENWYRIENGMVVVDNTFIDWNGFTDMKDVPYHTNELPAVFVSQALDEFVCYEGAHPWTNGELTYYTDVASQLSDNHPSVHNHSEDWFAWVSDKNEGFGLGVYVAGVDYFTSGRPAPNSKKTTNKNYDALSAPMVIDPELLSNKPAPTSPWTSCYVFNASYTAPVQFWTMREYEKMKYSYAISVDYINVMRQQFEQLSQQEKMKNELFAVWRANK